eukprot:g51744.t1
MNFSATAVLTANISSSLDSKLAAPGKPTSPTPVQTCSPSTRMGGSEKVFKPVLSPLSQLPVSPKEQTMGHEWESDEQSHAVKPSQPQIFSLPAPRHLIELRQELQQRQLLEQQQQLLEQQQQRQRLLKHHQHQILQHMLGEKKPQPQLPSLPLPTLGNPAAQGAVAGQQIHTLAAQPSHLRNNNAASASSSSMMWYSTTSPSLSTTITPALRGRPALSSDGVAALTSAIPISNAAHATHATPALSTSTSNSELNEQEQGQESMESGSPTTPPVLSSLKVNETTSSLGISSGLSSPSGQMLSVSLPSLPTATGTDGQTYSSVDELNVPSLPSATGSDGATYSSVDQANELNVGTVSAVGSSASLDALLDSLNNPGGLNVGSTLRNAAVLATPASSNPYGNGTATVLQAPFGSVNNNNVHNNSVFAQPQETLVLAQSPEGQYIMTRRVRTKQDPVIPAHLQPFPTLAQPSLAAQQHPEMILSRTVRFRKIPATVVAPRVPAFSARCCDSSFSIAALPPWQKRAIESIQQMQGAENLLGSPSHTGPCTLVRSTCCMRSLPSCLWEFKPEWKKQMLKPYPPKSAPYTLKCLLCKHKSYRTTQNRVLRGKLKEHGQVADEMEFEMQPEYASFAASSVQTQLDRDQAVTASLSSLRAELGAKRWAVNVDNKPSVQTGKHPTVAKIHDARALSAPYTRPPLDADIDHMHQLRRHTDEESYTKNGRLVWEVGERHVKPHVTVAHGV